MNNLQQAISDLVKRSSLERRMRLKVKRGGPDECWEWRGCLTSASYGRINAGRGFNFKAHRVAWALAHGAPDDDVCVCHKCDNPPCCNPDHLFLGSHMDNAQDMMSKGRGSPPPVRFGAAHHNSKFNDGAVLMIRGDKRPARVIALEFGVSEKTIYRIRQGKTRKEAA